MQNLGGISVNTLIFKVSDFHAAALNINLLSSIFTEFCSSISLLFQAVWQQKFKHT